MFGWVSTDTAKTAWGPVPALESLLEHTVGLLEDPRPPRIDRVIASLRAGATQRGPRPPDAQEPVAILADYFGVPPRYFTDPALVTDVHQDLRLRVLRRQFPTIDPAVLGGGMSRPACIKFLTSMSEANARDTSPPNDPGAGRHGHTDHPSSASPRPKPR
jgi:hypothetical protein